MTYNKQESSCVPTSDYKNSLIFEKSRHILSKKRAKVVVHGNCQAPFVGMLLSHCAFGLQHIDYEMTKMIHLATDADYESFKRSVSSADILLTQIIGDSFGGFSTEAAIDLLPPDAVAIKIPVCYFSGYNPELAYLREPEGGYPNKKLVDYHDIVMAKAVYEGASVQETVNLITASDFYSPSFVQSILQSNLDELRKREEDLNVSISSFVQENWAKQQLFYSFNHPASTVIRHVVDQILDILGGKALTDAEAGLQGEPLATHIFPIYSGILKESGLPLPPEPSFIRLHGRSRYTVEKYVEKQHSLYSKYPQIIKDSIFMYEQTGSDLMKSILSLPLPF